mgnify:CR=1 FL=1
MDTSAKYFLKGQVYDYKRVDTVVTVLYRIPYESDYYCVRLPNGNTSVASGSMLEPIK